MMISTGIKNCWIVTPAYNEEKKIEALLQGLDKIGLGVIVVDDGSKDSTATIAREHGCETLIHPFNIGQWGALRTGFYVALKKGAQVIVTLDSDGQHSLENIMDFITPILDNEADFIIGSRFLNGTPQMPRYRLYGIRLFNRLIKSSTGLDLTDCTSGFKAYRRELLEEILPYLKEPQYGALDSLMTISKFNPRIKEVPIENIPNPESNKGTVGYGYNLLRTLLNGL